jgi:multiple sugar transport system permease protein
MTSLKPQSQQLAIPPVWIPKSPTLENFDNLLDEPRVTLALKNSIIITSATLVLVMLLGIPAAYSMSRFRVGGVTLLLLVFIVRLLPPTAYLIPYFVIAQNLDIYDSQVALIVLYTFFTLPLAIWMLISFISDIPPDLEEAAMIDGATRLQALYRIVLPLMRPGIGAATVFVMITSWNEFALAATLTAREARTLPVIINIFVSGTNVDWGKLAAAGVISAIPIVAVGLLVQGQLVRGLSAGAVK